MELLKLKERLEKLERKLNNICVHGIVDAYDRANNTVIVEVIVGYNVQKKSHRTIKTIGLPYVNFSSSYVNTKFEPQKGDRVVILSPGFLETGIVIPYLPKKDKNEQEEDKEADYWQMLFKQGGMKYKNGYFELSTIINGKVVEAGGFVAKKHLNPFTGRPYPDGDEYSSSS